MRRRVTLESCRAMSCILLYRPCQSQNWTGKKAILAVGDHGKVPVSFLPILGVPISSFALLFAILGLAAAVFTVRETLRWTVAGFLLSALALAVNIAILYAPAGYLPSREVPGLWQPVLSRPYVSPPAP
jgi:hypothetical protein